LKNNKNTRFQSDRSDERNFIFFYSFFVHSIQQTNTCPIHKKKEEAKYVRTYIKQDKTKKEEKVITYYI